MDAAKYEQISASMQLPLFSAEWSARMQFPISSCPPPSSLPISPSHSRYISWEDDRSIASHQSSFLTVPSSHHLDTHLRQRQHPHHLSQQKQYQYSSSYADYYRERADSFGSTGSGATDLSSSPHDSYWSSGQTTASRGSPVGSPVNTSSPPLSQAGGNSSKLLNILLGNISFSDNLAAYVEQDRRRQRAPHIHVDSPSPEHRPSSARSLRDAMSPPQHLPASKRSSPRPERRTDHKRLALINPTDDTPIDLTFKKVTTASTESEVAITTEGSQTSAASSASSSPKMGERNTTILQTLLTGGCRVNAPFSSNLVPKQVYVSLAKRNQRHVQAHVSDWMSKITRFALDQSEFRLLTEDAQLALLTSSLPRLLLLSMAETNFHFAVAPTGGSLTDSCQGLPAGSGRSEVKGRPTMQTVEAVESFIARCDQLQIDSAEYSLMKLTTLFTPGDVDVPGEVAASTRASIGLLDYEQCTHGRHGYRARHSSLLLILHQLAAIEAEAVRRLFCVGDGLAGDALPARLRDLLRQAADVSADTQQQASSPFPSSSSSSLSC